MPLRKRIAFVSPLDTAFKHRLLRGALSAAELSDSVIIRDFILPRDFYHRATPEPSLVKLLAWQPDGLLCLLENEEINYLLEKLSDNCFAVNIASSQSRPRVAIVSADFSAMTKIVIDHFRHIGLRHVAMILLESEEQMQIQLVEQFLKIAQPKNTVAATFAEIVSPQILDDAEASVLPLPAGIEHWLKTLPKPVGIFCPQFGGGGYLIRVCHALDLRVPQDVAVIGVDDADVGLQSQPSLTTVRALSANIGKQALAVLLEMIRTKKEPTKRVSINGFDLMIRQSTGAIRGEICDIAAALAHIDRYACAGLQVTALIEQTQKVSRKTFHTHFKLITGQTPGEAISARKIEQARHYLWDTTLPLTAIAEKCGFGSASDFARRFRLCVGLTPSEYRAKKNGTHASPAP